MTCSNCIFFRKEVVDLTNVTSYLTYINVSGLDFAQCSNESVTNEIISRSAEGQFFFDDANIVSIFGDIPVACELDTCEFFTSIEE